MRRLNVGHQSLLVRRPAPDGVPASPVEAGVTFVAAGAKQTAASLPSVPFNVNESGSRQQDHEDEDRQDCGGATPPTPVLFAGLSSVAVRAQAAHGVPHSYTGAVTVAALDGTRQRV